MGVGAFHCCPSTTKTITRAAAFVAFWWPFLGVNKAISKWACNATSTIYWWSCISCRNVIRLCVTQMDLTEIRLQNWVFGYFTLMYLTFNWIWAIGNSGFLICFLLQSNHPSDYYLKLDIVLGVAFCPCRALCVSFMVCTFLLKFSPWRRALSLVVAT